jgi:FkbM family methyltransferase
MERPTTPIHRERLPEAETPHNVPVLRKILLSKRSCRLGAVGGRKSVFRNRHLGNRGCNLFWGQATSMKAQLERLAEARGETVDQVRKRFSEEEITQCPPRFSKHLAAVRRAKLARTGVRDGLAFAELDNGRVFYSFVSQPNHRKEYRYVADTLSDAITEETYLASIDVVQRYITDYAWPPGGLVPQGSANIIELGAYLGHKTIRFAEELASKGGRILAVEMMPENCAILRRNVVENELEKIVDVRNVGVWRETGTIEIYSKGRQRNSILPIDKLQDGTRVLVSVESLDRIIDDWGVKPIDLVFVTVNGAETQILQSFHPEGRDVHAFFVAAPYAATGGTPNSKVCKELLNSKGYAIVDVTNQDRVVAKYHT